MRTCPKCNVNVLDEDAKFCIECGANLNVTSAALEEIPPKPVAQKKKSPIVLGRKSAVRNLKTGQSINLSKICSNLDSVTIALSWNCPNEFDVDLSAFLTDENDEAVSEEDFIFYNNPSHVSNCAEYVAVSDTEEKIELNLKDLPPEIAKIKLVLSINDEDDLQQDFSEVSDITMKIMDSDKERLVYNLTEKFTSETAIIIAEIYRKEDSWQCEAVSKGYEGGLVELCEIFGLEVQ